MIRHDIPSGDGTRLAVFETGPADGFPILLIHGWSQHHLSWARQLDSALPKTLRLIVPDLRGHGASAKPDDPRAYNHSSPWAQDIAAVITALNLKAPALVGWSMGGWVVQDYLRVHGPKDISGVMLVGSSITTGRHSPAEARLQRDADADVVAEGMYSEDQAANISATLDFVKACFASPPQPDDLARMVGFNMLVPPHIRIACRRRQEDYRTLWQGITLPTTIVTGALERLSLPAAVQEMQDHIPHAQILTYPGCGHAPFWEDPQRFNSDLETFATQCQKEAA